MKKLILTYLTSSLIIANSFAQKLDSTTYNILYYDIKLTNIQFSIDDTLIPYSLLVEPTGEIDFEEGYDFSFEKIGIASFHFGNKRKNIKGGNDRIISTNDKPVKLTSYFPPLNRDSMKFINGYDLKFDWSPHYEYEIRQSYILNGISAKKLYQSDMDSIVRIIIPEDQVYKKPHKEIYNIFRINLKQNPIEIQHTKTQHHYNGNFEIIEKGISYILKKKDIETLFTEFEKLNLSKDSYFIKVDGSSQYFIEFKTAISYFAGMRHYRDKDGRIPENSFPWTVKHLYQKYTKRR